MTEKIVLQDFNEKVQRKLSLTYFFLKSKPLEGPVKNFQKS